MGVTVRQFATIRDVTKTRVYQMRKEGLLVFDDDGTINAEESNKKINSMSRSYNNYGKRTTAKVQQVELRAKQAREEETLKAMALLAANDAPLLTHSEAITKKEHYLAALRELEYDIEAKKVVTVESVLKQVSTEYTALRAAILSLPTKLAPRVIVMNNAEEARDFIEKAVQDCLTALMYDEQLPKGN